MPQVLPNVLTKAVLVRSVGALSIPSRTVQIAASQTIKAGDFLGKTSGANTFEQALALPGSNNSVTASGGNGAFAAIACESITTTPGGVETATGKTAIQVYMLDAHLEFAIRIYNSTASDAEFNDIALGTPYQLGRFRGASANEWFYVLTTTTTNGEIVPVGIYAGSSPTDDYGAVWSRLVTTEANQVL